MITTWFRRLLEYLGYPKPPVPTTGDTSVLFCLHNKSPMTFEELQDATHILAADLRKEMEWLEWHGRVSVVHELSNQGFACREYHLIRESKPHKM